MRYLRIISILVLLSLIVTACGGAATPAPTQPAAEKPAAEQPAAAEPTAEQPAAEEPTAEQPAAEEPAAASGETIKVALLFPMTGDVATFGKSSKEGAELAIQEWNEKGGPNGQQVEWIVGDSRCDAQEARNQATKVIEQDKVGYIIGEVCSSASIPVSEVANAKKVLQISPTSTNPAVTVDEAGNHKPYTYRACFLDPFQGDVLATFAFNDLGAKTAAILYDQGNDYVRGLGEYIKASFEKLGGTVAVYEAYNKDDTDFSVLLSKVKDANVDVLYVPDYYNKVSLIGTQARERGITIPMMGGDGWDSPELDLAAVEGGYFSNHYSVADPRDVVQNFIKKYTEKYGAAPDALAVLAYDAANILMQSIDDAKSSDPTVVKDAMQKIQFEGVSGKITFDDKGNPIKAAALTAIKGGKLELVRFVEP